MASELAAAVDSIMTKNTVKSIFDPIDTPSTSPPIEPLRTLSDESSDEETRNFILKFDGFVPRSTSQTPRISIRKTPRVRNAPKCTYLVKRGKRKGEVCGTMCRLGDQFCAKHKVKENKAAAIKLNFESIAVKTRLERLKVSRSYEVLESQESTAFFKNSGRILKVILPKSLMAIPKTGSFFKFVRAEDGEKKWKAVWESI